MGLSLGDKAFQVIAIFLAVISNCYPRIIFCIEIIMCTCVIFFFFIMRIKQLNKIGN